MRKAILLAAAVAVLTPAAARADQVFAMSIRLLAAHERGCPGLRLRPAGLFDLVESRGLMLRWSKSRIEREAERTGNAMFDEYRDGPQRFCARAKRDAQTFRELLKRYRAI